MKIFSAGQIASIDRQTREEEGISDAVLMERASGALADWLIQRYPATTRVAVVAGPGNNGGDAMVVARMLSLAGFPVTLILPAFGSKRSEASQLSLERLRNETTVPVVEPAEQELLPSLSGYDLLLDGLYGSGLSRPLEGYQRKVVDWMNALGCQIVSIDIPSGLMCDENRYNTGARVKANITLALEFPRLALFFRENEPFFGKWEVIPFGLSKKAIEETPTGFSFLDRESVSPMLRRRKLFSHKGTYGHGILFSGSKGKYGAAHLAARGALRSGLGLLTVHMPENGHLALNIALPEAMTSADPGEDFLTTLPDLSAYTALAAGPGIGQSIETQLFVKQLTEIARVPVVLDADALNILARNPAWLKNLPEDTILTPHPLEFDRLSGIAVKTDEERFFMASEFSSAYKAIVVLKGAYTRVFFPDGRVSFNSTGNPGMATAGSGDVLTGILLGLLCQGYAPAEAALLGVFLHGKSADLKVESSSEESLMAGDIADGLGEAFASLKCC